MQENVQYIDSIAIIKFNQRMDVQKSVKTENLIIDIIENKTNKLVFDMSDVTYISSSGLRIFVATLRRLKDTEGTLKIVGMKNKIKEIFQTVELLDLLDLYNSVNEAINSIKQS